MTNGECSSTDYDHAESWCRETIASGHCMMFSLSSFHHEIASASQKFGLSFEVCERFSPSTVVFFWCWSITHWFSLAYQHDNNPHHITCLLTYIKTTNRPYTPSSATLTLHTWNAPPTPYDHKLWGMWNPTWMVRQLWIWQGNVTIHRQWWLGWLLKIYHHHHLQTKTQIRIVQMVMILLFQNKVFRQ